MGVVEPVTLSTRVVQEAEMHLNSFYNTICVDQIKLILHFIIFFFTFYQYGRRGTGDPFNTCRTGSGNAPRGRHVGREWRAALRRLPRHDAPARRERGQAQYAHVLR